MHCLENRRNQSGCLSVLSDDKVCCHCPYLQWCLPSVDTHRLDISPLAPQALTPGLICHTYLSGSCPPRQ